MRLISWIMHTWTKFEEADCIMIKRILMKNMITLPVENFLVWKACVQK